MKALRTRQNVYTFISTKAYGFLNVLSCNVLEHPRCLHNASVLPVIKRIESSVGRGGLR